MKESTRKKLNEHADTCAMSSSDAFSIFHECLRAQNREYCPDLSYDDKENNALFMACKSMTARAIREY